ncbi:MAG: type II toxin-antitoxin system VapC family toxin [Sphingomonadales bacterium]|nr:type II toxin-antitoxin system VapC family toxin [Sphingomonadales bacterium]
MILLDTNVLSELLRPDPDQRVIDWVDAHTDQAHVPAQVLAEILYGARLLEDHRRRSTLMHAIGLQLIRFDDRIVPFDRAAAESYGPLKARMRQAGTPLPEVDAQIAATAMAHEAPLATRNLKDFERTGIALIDPWSA